MQNQTEFGKYTEDDEEDYEDVFGKPNATCELAGGYLSVLGACADSAFVAATEHPMQTLQLNTRLSSKSWVNQVGIHY